MKAFLMTCRTLWHCEISNPLSAAAPGVGFRSDPCTDRFPFGKPQQAQVRRRVRAVSAPAPDSLPELSFPLELRFTRASRADADVPDAL